MSVGSVLSDLFGQLGEVGPIVGGFIIILGAGIIGQVFQIDLSAVMIGVGVLIVIYILCVFGSRW
ncbi:MAG: hypothetical protein KGD60_15165, partial [Candidatus Thorarchaeota archaeon]|nr:hypothetical protein [Candidatus Thorarchaeota archaeon]